MTIFSLLVLAFGAWLMYRLLRPRNQPRPKQPWGTRRHHHQAPQPEEPASRTTELLECAHCGIHAPADSGVRHGDVWYCSKDHLKQHKQ